MDDKLGLSVAIDEARATRKLCEEVLRKMDRMESAVRIIADDQMEQRTGIPSDWKRRLVLVGVSSAIAAPSAVLLSWALQRFAW